MKYFCLLCATRRVVHCLCTYHVQADLGARYGLLRIVIIVWYALELRIGS